MDVFGEMYLSYPDSQRYFGEFQTKVKFKITNADLIAKETMGMVYFTEERYGPYYVENNDEIVPCRLEDATTEFYDIRKEIDKRIKDIAVRIAIKNKTTEVVFDASEIFDEKLENEIEEIMAEVAMS